MPLVQLAEPDLSRRVDEAVEREGPGWIFPGAGELRRVLVLAGCKRWDIDDVGIPLAALPGAVVLVAGPVTCEKGTYVLGCLTSGS
jgi:hypothetical protein